MPHKNLKSLIDFASQQMRSEFDNATHIFASNKHSQDYGVIHLNGHPIDYLFQEKMLLFIATGPCF